MDQKKIGKFIASARKNKKLTQEELSQKLGVTNRAVSNWENGNNMPDLSLFKPLCNILDITLNELLSGEKLTKDNNDEKFEENIFNTINYTNKKIKLNDYLVGSILLTFGILISVCALSVIPSESSWSSIYSIIGVLISLIGVTRFTKRLKNWKKVLCNIDYFLSFIIILLIIDYIGVVNINQAPRFSILTSTGESNGKKMIYYDTLFYDVIRCNVDLENETFIVINNQKDQENISSMCK